MNYYLPRDYKYKRINDAGSKARTDIEKIMECQDIHPIARPRTISKNRILHFIRTLIIMVHLTKRIKKNDILILQYPTKYYSYVCWITHLRGAQVVSFIHDLGCFRKKHNTPQKEISLLNKSDAVIACNDATQNWLHTHGFVGYNRAGISESLCAFDFLSDAVCPIRKETWPLNKIVYAGQLSRQKNRFLYEFGANIQNYTVNIYGTGFDRSSAINAEKFNVKGFMKPDELIKKSEGDFGLVWDGDSVDCCNGDWGEYLMINTPHKVSLYIRCGLPLLIWRKAAMATFVEQNGIGICIDSLRDISDIYKNLHAEEYAQMCDNVLHMNHLMAEGHFFKEATIKVLSHLHNLGSDDLL